MGTSEFDAILEAETEAANYDLTTDDIIVRLTEWQALCDLRVTHADEQTIEIVFDTLPRDMDSFVHDLHEFCPDLVEQGTGCVGETIEATGQVPADMKGLIEGLDLDDDSAGLEILKRIILRDREMRLWWD